MNVCCLQINHPGQVPAPSHILEGVVPHAEMEQAHVVRHVQPIIRCMQIIIIKHFWIHLTRHFYSKKIINSWTYQNFFPWVCINNKITTFLKAKHFYSQSRSVQTLYGDSCSCSVRFRKRSNSIIVRLSHCFKASLLWCCHPYFQNKEHQTIIQTRIVIYRIVI